MQYELKHRDPFALYKGGFYVYKNGTEMGCADRWLCHDGLFRDAYEAVVKDRWLFNSRRWAIQVFKKVLPQCPLVDKTK